MKKIIALAPALLLLASCISLNPRSHSAGPSAVTLPNMPMHKWGIESCGAGSLSTVLQHYGDKTTMQQWDESLPKTRGGVMSVDMLLAARQRGFDAQLVTGDAQLVTEEVRQGRPVILMLQVVDYPGHHYDFFHYVVVDGIDPEHGLIRAQFGDGKGRWTTFERLEKIWTGAGHAAILIHPHDAKHDPASDTLRAAVELEDQGKFAEAATAYRKIVADHPDSLVAWTDLGNAETQLGHRKEAAEAFRKALAIDDHSRDALNNLAWLLYEEKQYAEAETLARRATAEKGPDGYLYLDTLARVLAASGNCPEAILTFQQAIAAVPPARTAEKTKLETGLAEAKQSCLKG